MRAETLRDKATFRDEFQHRRCLVLADGFYEWKATAAGKVPYRIHAKGGAPLAFGGLWEEGPEPKFAIITTAANALMAPIHHRMPLIFAPDEKDAWLASGASLTMLLDELKPADRKDLESYEVSRRVNNARLDESELLRPL